MLTVKRLEEILTLLMEMSANKIIIHNLSELALL